ncbi:MAG: UbiA family prenyltransferase [Myxococcota bacterium]
MMTPKDHLIHRMRAYLNERFPPLSYTILVTLFFGSGVLFARALSSDLPSLSPVVALGAGVVWLVFFHLRVFDEHKDHEQDAQAHPDRLLSRGVVTLPLLARLAGLALLAEASASAVIGPRALLWWALTAGFTVAMRFEFGVGAFLNRHLLLYAVTHNPVVGLLAMYAWACSGADFSVELLWFVGAASLASLAFEIGRKTRQPEEEIEGVDSYSSVYGRNNVSIVLRLIMVAGVICAGSAVSVVVTDGPQLWGAVGALAVSLGVGMSSARNSQSAKRVELGSTIFLLGLLLAMGIASW